MKTLAPTLCVVYWRQSFVALSPGITADTFNNLETRAKPKRGLILGASELQPALQLGEECVNAGSGAV